MKNKSSQTQLVTNILASKWAIRVVYTLSSGTKRYGELRKSIDGITEKALTDTLKHLERHGLLKRKYHASIPPKVEYKLTVDGFDLIEIMDSMALWGDRHSDKIRRAQNAYDHEKDVS